MERKFLVQPGEGIFLADYEISRVVASGFGGDGLEGDLGADAGDIAEGDADPASH